MPNWVEWLRHIFGNDSAWRRPLNIKRFDIFPSWISFADECRKHYRGNEGTKDTDINLALKELVIPQGGMGITDKTTMNKVFHLKFPWLLFYAKVNRLDKSNMQDYRCLNTGKMGNDMSFCWVLNTNQSDQGIRNRDLNFGFEFTQTRPPLPQLESENYQQKCMTTSRFTGKKSSCWHQLC